MVFNSVQFLIFLPVVLLVCFGLPKRIRYIWLLAASYYFYACWNARYALLLLLSTITTYLCGLLLSIAHRSDTSVRGGQLRRLMPANASGCGLWWPLAC